MSFTITNAQTGSSFEAKSDESILDAALKANLVFPYGCRSGVCGACKCKILQGEIEYGTHEDFALSDEEKENGLGLICCAKATTDVVIDCKEISAEKQVKIKMLPCRVGQMQTLSDDVMQMFLQLPKTQSFDFINGQYIDIILKDGQRRSFSIANSAAQAKFEGLELHVRLIPDGQFTPRIFSSMRERDLLRFEGPFGTYILQSDASSPIIMIATGTGFAPIKALVQQCLSENPEQSIHLFWGGRLAKDLYMHELANQWQQDYPNFTYTPVLSRDDNWQGAKGHVQDAVLAKYTDLSGFDVYASGSPAMIDSVRDQLGQHGMQSDRFYFDSFEFAKS